MESEIQDCISNVPNVSQGQQANPGLISCKPLHQPASPILQTEKAPTLGLQEHLVIKSVPREVSILKACVLSPAGNNNSLPLFIQGTNPTSRNRRHLLPQREGLL